MIKHTPGPWRVNGKQSIRGENGEYIARANWNNGEANASLIAAAPDLLDDLIVAVGHIRELCHALKIPLPISTLSRADATIARAKGEA